MPQKRTRARPTHQAVATTSTLPYAAVESCPAEIWGRIFSEACIDDGNTGRSLSLVSRYIHDTSKPYKYQCLIVEERQFRSLATTLKKLPPESRRVRHLLLISKVWSSGAYWKRDAEFFRADKNRLLILVSSTLQTLEIACHEGTPYLTFPMPALLDLTVHGATFYEDLPSRPAVCYPQLRRFHLAGCGNLSSGKPLDRLGTIAPKIEELRVSLSSASGFGLQSTMQYLYATFLGERHANHSRSATSLPSGMVKIIFQPMLALEYYPFLVEKFRDIRRGDSKFVLLAEDPRRVLPHEIPAALKSLWKQCRAGSRDYWNPADYEIDTG